jgi:hypothetical protein
MPTRNLARCCVLALALAIAPPEGMSAEPLTPDETSRLAALDAKALQQFSNVDLGDYVQLRHRRLAANPPSVGDEITYFAMKAIDQPYFLGCGRFDWTVGDCITVTERTIAVALSYDWDSFYRLSQRMRHKDGIVDYRNRNFDTLGDWVPSNAWLLRPINEELGPPENRPAQSFTYVVRPKVFKDVQKAKGPGTVFVGIDKASANTGARTFSYIPQGRLPDVLSELRAGDIFIAIVQRPDVGWRGEHVGFIVRDEAGVVNVLHSAPPKMRREPLTSAMERWSWVKGLMFLRVRDDARQLVDAELQRIAPTVSVVPAPEQDAKTVELRAVLEQEKKATHDRLVQEIIAKKRAAASRPAAQQ